MAVVSKQNLLDRSTVIINETQTGANDQNRVGTLFYDTVDTLSMLSGTPQMDFRVMKESTTGQIVGRYVKGTPPPPPPPPITVNVPVYEFILKNYSDFADKQPELILERYRRRREAAHSDYGQGGKQDYASKFREPIVVGNGAVYITRIPLTGEHTRGSFGIDRFFTYAEGGIDGNLYPYARGIDLRSLDFKSTKDIHTSSCILRYRLKWVDGGTTYISEPLIKVLAALYLRRGGGNEIFAYMNIRQLA